MKCKTNTCNSEIELPQSFCLVCIKQKKSQDYKKWFEKNKEKKKSYNKKWRDNNKDHCSQYGKNYLSLHREDLKKYNHQWYVSNIENEKFKESKFARTIDRRFYNLKKRAKKKNILCSLLIEQYKQIIISPCYYCNNFLCEIVAAGGGLDRLDNTRGYELDNVVSCGKICNSIKMNYLTPQETKAAVEAILKVRYPNG